MTREQAARWLPSIGLGALVLFLGAWEVLGDHHYTSLNDRDQVLWVCGFAVAVASYRIRPGLALALLWPLAILQLWAGVPLLLVQLAVTLVAYGCGRYGSPATLVSSVLSVPAIAVVVLVITSEFGLPRANRFYYDFFMEAPEVYSVASVGTFGIAVLVVPWLIGVVVRVLRREQRTKAGRVEAERERDQAAELADLREGQARLARDVHDVVGHSLAVILAQAESGQYLPEDDPERLKETLATIATSARTSLQDVRNVLGATGDQPPRGGLDTLIDGVRASGHEVLSTEIGEVRPLPPELEVVAYRVLQEMLTNAIRHGRRDEPVHVERHWQDELRIEVRNVIATAHVPTGAFAGGAESAPPESGHGLEGMRRRLEAVGGRLDVRPRGGTGDPTFTITAWLPTGAR